MSNATTASHEIPAPPPPGSADVVDEMLVGLAAPPQTRRRVLNALLVTVAVTSLALAAQFRDDLVYAMSSSTPTDLGDGITAAPSPADLNRYVTLRARPSMAGAVTYSRVLAPGQHLVFPVAGRDGRPPLYVQVSDENRDVLARGEFQGRLIPFNAAGRRYANVGAFVHNRLDPRVSGTTWLLVDGARPQSMMWAPFVVTFLLALALSDLALLFRLRRPADE